MLSKLSVKKPYTVVVAIVLVLILGVVSFSRMSTDLLPSMSLPYAVVVTTYPGASPETVETVVTRPIEQAMATVTDIENISSTSSENYSMVILEFTQTADMNNATLEMRENLDQIKGYWDDSVSNPIIMKLNPDMMPIMIAAVEIDGKDASDVTDYVENHLESQLESVAGVASVSTTGTITENVSITLQEDKMAEVNEKVEAAIRDQFSEKEEELDDAQQELDDGREELEDGKEQLEDGKEQLEDGKEQLATGLATGRQQLDEAGDTLNATEAELKSKQEDLESAQAMVEAGLEQLDSGLEQAETGLETLEQTSLGMETLVTAIDTMKGQEENLNLALEEINGALELLDTTEEELDANEKKLDDGITALDRMIEAEKMGLDPYSVDLSDLDLSAISMGGSLPLTPPGSTESMDSDELFIDETIDILSEEILSVPTISGSFTEQRDALAEQRAALEGGRSTIEEQREALLEQKEQIESGLGELVLQREGLEEQLDAVITALGQTSLEDARTFLSEQTQILEDTIEELEGNRETLVATQEELESGKELLDEGMEQLQSGKTQLSSGKVTLDTQQILATIEMSVGSMKLEAASTTITQTEAQLDAAQEQLDNGREQMEDALKSTLKSTDIRNILTKDLVSAMLAGENFSMPAGYIEEGKDSFLVRVGDKFTDRSSLEDLVILDMGMDGLDPIRLGDVADIVKNDNSHEVYATLNGQPGVILTFEKQTGYSTGDVTDSLMKRMDEISEEDPNVHFSVLMDQGVYIDLVVDSVLGNMLSGGVLAVLVLLLFLKDLRPTIVIAFSIPISVVAAFVMMYFTGITLNIISLSGLALGIGMLVDNSIVVIENIDRLRGLGVSPRRAAVEGAKGVAGAIAASTLTTVCVFAPIVFTQGITRQLFVEMGLTIAYSLLASLIVALTLVPMMSAGLLKKTGKKKEGFLGWIRKGYCSILRIALKLKLLVLIAAIAVLVFSVRLALQKGTAYMPEMESTQASLTVTAEEGTPFEDLCSMTDEVIAAIESIEDITDIGATAGGNSLISSMGGSGGGTAESVSVYLMLKEDKELSGDELEAEILERCKDIPCYVNVSTQTMDLSALGGSGISVQIKGKELDELYRLAGEVAEIIEDTEGTCDVSDGLEKSDEEFRITVNKSKAMSYSLTVAQVYQAVAARLQAARSATTLSTIDKDYSVFVYDEKDEKLTRKDLENMVFEYQNKEGETKKVKLKRFAEFSSAIGPQTIRRDSQSRYVTVSAGIDKDHNIGLVSAELTPKLEALQLPSGYSVEMTGEDETINDAMGQLVEMLLLALVFMYLIMVAQFQSLLSPFIIMFTVPLAFTGGFLGLVIADMEISVIAMIGFVMLSGIIVNNGIVLVDYTNQLRAAGMEKREALIQAGHDRLRPIIMTALTTILGLSTMAIGGNMGSDMIQPMAVVTIGGLIYGTILTLFVVPCIYDILNRKDYRHDDSDLEEDLDIEDSPIIWEKLES